MKMTCIRHPDKGNAIVNKDGLPILLINLVTFIM